MRLHVHRPMFRSFEAATPSELRASCTCDWFRMDVVWVRVTTCVAIHKLCQQNYVTVSVGMEYLVLLWVVDYEW